MIRGSDRGLDLELGVLGRDGHGKGGTVDWNRMQDADLDYPVPSFGSSCDWGLIRARGEFKGMATGKMT